MTSDPAPRRPLVSRRSFLGGLGALAGTSLLPVRPQRDLVTSTPAAFTSTGPVTAAMHVHGSWSEGAASWGMQFTQARSIGADLIYLTDHDFRALAYDYLSSLDGVPYMTSTTGAARQQQVTASDESLRLLVESSSTSPATVKAAVETRPTMWDHARTSIAGTVLSHTLTSATLSDGATYEVIVHLSRHPATKTRQEGQYALHYRYGDAAPGRQLVDGGLTGVVQLGPPDPGTTHNFDLTADVAAFWPDMYAIDNALFSLAFVATSPRPGAVADVVRGSFGFNRAARDQAGLRAQQAALIDAYADRFPALAIRGSVEVSRLDPHVIMFGVPPVFPDQDLITEDTADAFYSGLSAGVHADGGLVSWNHAFGANAGPLLTKAEQAAKRRAVFADMLSRNWYAADILEVGYTVRGSVSTQTHFDLWDTFSRRAIFLTGNGVNDDHVGRNWAGLSNGWTTGIWAASSADADVLPALQAGRAYTRHAGRWRNGRIDLLVDNRIRMGQVDVRNFGTSRTLAVSATALPSGSTVELVRGPVVGSDTALDPGTSIVARIAAAAFRGSGVVSRKIDTTRSCFVRAQVRNSAGALIGTSNPVWLLRSAPPGGIPQPRQN